MARGEKISFGAIDQDSTPMFDHSKNRIQNTGVARGESHIFGSSLDTSRDLIEGFKDESKQFSLQGKVSNVIANLMHQSTKAVSLTRKIMPSNRPNPKMISRKAARTQANLARPNGGN